MQSQRPISEILVPQPWLKSPTFHWNEGRLVWAAAALLAMMAGYLDGYALLFLKTYVSFMSGNTTTAGLRSGQGDFHAAIPAAIAIVFFVAGSFLAGSMLQSKLRHAHRVVFALIAVGLASVGGLEWINLHNVNFEIGLLSLLMGMTNPALAKIGAQTVSLTFMTGALSRIGGNLASALGGKPPKDKERPSDSHLAQAGIEAGIWCGFLVGAVLAGLAGSNFRTWALLPPAVVMLALGLLSDRAATSPEEI
jgi:uncharacterized membrane protein YoaK (UPF0700 family)